MGGNYPFGMVKYDIVSLDDVTKTANPLELDLYSNTRESIRRANELKTGVQLPQIDAWNYNAYHEGGKMRSIGSRDLPSALSSLEESLREYHHQPFTGLILHGYRLAESEQKQVMDRLNIPLVALMMEAPVAVAPHGMGRTRLELGGFCIEFGGHIGLSIMM